MKTKYIVIISVVVVVLIWFAASKGKSTTIKVTTEKSEQRDIIESVSASGKIYPETEVKISSDVSGEIIELTVEAGDSVKIGQLLCRINPELYESAMEQMKATLNNAKAGLATYEAQMSRAKANLNQQEANYNRQKKLYQDKVISTAEFETAEANFNISKAEFETAKKNVLAAKFNVESNAARLEESQRNYGRTNIYSPIAGIVTSLSVEKGERVVGTSQMAGTEMMKIAQLDFMEVRVDVNENDIIRIEKGDTANIEVDAYKRMKFKGVVSQVARSAKSGLATDNQAVNYEVRVRILPDSYKNLIENKQDFPFLSGMTGSVDIRTKIVRDVLSVPVSAVVMRDKSAFESDSSSTKDAGSSEKFESVFVVENGKTKIKKVKTGIQDGNHIQILEGLKAGEDVVSGPYGTLTSILKNNLEVDVTDKDKIFITQ